MAQGHRKAERQAELWVDTRSIVPSAHPFYSQINEVLEKHGFDRHVEQLTAEFHKEGGRPGIPAGNYFRMMMIGFFEGLGSEREIAWRVADSFSLRHFLGLGLTEESPDHSSLSVIRRRFTTEVHQQAFQFIQTILAREGQLKGHTVGIDATTIKANAAIRELQRKDTRERYSEYVKRLAEAAGEPAATAEEVARFDRKRKGRKCSNGEWEHPHDPEARIGRDKHGATDMLYKLEKADDLETGAIISVTVQAADTGDPESMDDTLAQADENLAVVAGDSEAPGGKVAEEVSEAVCDKGYHSNDICLAARVMGLRTYIGEPERGRRCWEGKAEERRAVYGNRRRIKGERGKRLRKLRAELCERSFAHLCDTGGQRRTFLRGIAEVSKKAFIGAMGFNMSLLLRKVFGMGKPRRSGAFSGGFSAVFRLVFMSLRPTWRVSAVTGVFSGIVLAFWHFWHSRRGRRPAAA